MKITIATGPMFPVPPVLGGAIPRIWQGLAEQFAAKGHDVLVVAKAHESQPTQETHDGVRYLRWGGFHQSRSVYYDLIRGLIYARRLLPRLPAADILVTNEFWLPFLAPQNRQAGKVVVNCNRYPKNQYWLYHRAACLAATSRAVADAIARQTPSMAGKIRVLPNPVDTRRFHPPSVERQGDQLQHILFVGRLHPEKGVHLLVEAFRLLAARHPAARLTLVGPHQTEQGGGGAVYLQQLKTAAQHAAVSFVGPVFDLDHLASAYRDAGIFCYPSLAEKGEAFGVAPLEAMATGATPVVSSLACFDDFIRHETNGIVFNHRDENPAATLSLHLQNLLDSAETIKRMGNAAFQSAQSYDFSHVAEAYLLEFTRLSQRDASDPQDAR